MNQKTVTLRPIALSDTANIVRWRNQKDVCKNLYTTAVLTAQQHMHWLETNVRTGKCVQYIICIKDDTACRDVGTVFIKNIDRRSQKGEFGIFIGEAWARGKGYARQATYQILNIAFQELALNRVYLSVMSDNYPGIHSYKKAGFLEEGVLKEEYLRDDGYVDVVIMGITKQEWQTKKDTYVLSGSETAGTVAPKIAIIGASVSQNPLILKAKEMGYETHVFAWKTGDIGETTADFFYPISIMNIDEICEKCQQLQPAGIATIASDHAAVTAQQLAQRLGLPSNTRQTMDQMTNKLLMHQLFDGIIPQASYWVVDDRLEGSLYDGQLCYPCVVKPTDRTGGRGVTKVCNRRELMDAIACARDLSFERKAIIEEYIEGKEYSCEMFSVSGKHHVIAYTYVRQTDGGRSLLHQEYSQPVAFSAGLKEKADALMIKVLDTLGHQHGPSHIEFVVDADQQIKIIEVSPTIGGDGVGALLTPASTGIDYLKLVIQGACGTLPPDETGAFSPERKSSSLFSVRLVNCAADYARFEAQLQEGNSPVVDASGLFGLNAQDIGSSVRKYGYYMVRYPQIEMGSYLPLELPAGATPFDHYPEQSILALNSIKSALLMAMRCIGTDTVYVPYVYSTSLVSLLEKNGFHVCKYHLGPDLLPAEPLLGKTVVLMNYFGIMDQRLAAYAKSGSCRIIADHSLAYFAPHIPGTYSIYECTKFLGVTNGAYLVGDINCSTQLPRDQAYMRSSHLLKALELGASGAYKDYYTNEQRIGSEISLMSVLTRRLLSGIDYSGIRSARQENYDFLDSRLSGEKLLRDGDTVPQCYPLIGSPQLRDMLLNNKIFVPSYWRKCTADPALNNIERMLADQICCLPIDQRYTPVQMEYLAQLIDSCL